MITVKQAREALAHLDDEAVLVVGYDGLLNHCHSQPAEVYCRPVTGYHGDLTQCETQESGALHAYRLGSGGDL